MNSKSLFFGLLTATLTLTSLAALKPASATPPNLANLKASLIAQGDAAAPQLNITDPVAIEKTTSDNADESAKRRRIRR
jgi:hypothetical protein